MAQQTWAEWLLDSYATAVSPVATEGSEASFEDNDTSYLSTSPPNTMPDSFASHITSPTYSSGYGPYIRTGRGGAGNFTWQSDTASQSSDVESQQPTLAQRRQATAKLEHLNTVDALRAKSAIRSSSLPFTNSGRGGAGNYARSVSIDVQQPSPNSPSGSRPSSSATTQYVYTGRGGAGNYAAAAEKKGAADASKDIELQEMAAKRRLEIETTVSSMLKPPPGAWLGGRRKSDAMSDAEV